MSEKNENKDNPKRKALRITMLGDTTVGKTSITNRFLNIEFSNDSLSTLGKSRMDTTMKMKDGKKMKVIIIDTAGQERFHSIATSTIKGANGIVVSFDLTNQGTFSNVTRWLKEINDNTDKIPIVIFGNKCDLKEKRVVQQKDIDDFLKKHKLSYFETSAKLDINIKEGFKKIIEDAYESSGGPMGSELKIDKKDKKKKGCC